jgi:uncharacterized protein (DUF2345 family)
LARALANSVRAAKAIPADTDAQKQVNDELNGLKEPGLLVSAPASIGIVSGRGVQVVAQDNISAVAGKNVDVSAVKRFTMAAGEAVSMFAQKLGIKLFAGKGPVQIQAQSDALSLLADRDVTVSSVNGKVDIAAAKELILECDGAFVKLTDGNITLGGPGDLFLKVITIQKQGAASTHLGGPPFAQSLFPVILACEAWQGTTRMAEATSPAPDIPPAGPGTAASLAPTSPALDAAAPAPMGPAVDAAPPAPFFSTIFGAKETLAKGNHLVARFACGLAVHREYDRTPLNWARPDRMLVMILWRQRVAVNRNSLNATDFASIDARIRGGCAGRVQGVQRNVINVR